MAQSIISSSTISPRYLGMHVYSDLKSPLPSGCTSGSNIKKLSLQSDNSGKPSGTILSSIENPPLSSYINSFPFPYSTGGVLSDTSGNQYKATLGVKICICFLAPLC